MADIALDLGTSLFKLYMEGSGLVTKVPSVVTYDTQEETVVAMGREAYQMIGRTSERMEVVRPLHNGVISDFSMAQQLILHYFKEACGHRVLMPRVVISVPCQITEVQKRAVVDAVSAAGVRKIALIEEPVAAALGAGVDISGPHGTCVVDIGGGATDLAVISLGGIAVSDSVSVAGNTFSENIIKYVRRKFGLIIGERMAEDAKVAIGCAYPRRRLEHYVLRGISARRGLPESVIITSDEMLEALLDSCMQIVHRVQQVLEKTPPEMLGDVLTDGIVLTGGSAALYGIDLLLSQKLKVPVRVAENPENCVVLGAGQAIPFMDVRDNRSGGTLNPLLSVY